MSVAGLERTWRVFAADDVRPGAPVAVVLHGGGDRAGRMAAATGFDDAAREHGFVAVYPQAYRERFNAGIRCSHVRGRRGVRRPARRHGRPAVRRWRARNRRWRARNRCPNRTIVHRTDTVSRWETAGCRRGTSVRLVVPAAGGHRWFGAPPPYGSPDDPIAAIAEIAAFLAGVGPRYPGVRIRSGAQAPTAGRVQLHPFMAAPVHQLGRASAAAPPRT